MWSYTPRLKTTSSTSSKPPTHTHTHTCNGHTLQQQMLHYSQKLFKYAVHIDWVLWPVGVRLFLVWQSNCCVHKWFAVLCVNFHLQDCADTWSAPVILLAVLILRCSLAWSWICIFPQVHMRSKNKTLQDRFIRHLENPIVEAKWFNFLTKNNLLHAQSLNLK